jgi:Tol biopolymer transport system component
MPLSAGTRLGPYEILSALGTGGMGEVYLGHDPRLRRNVAIKLLPARFTEDAERVRRFQREAQAASALNHPNIITIHEIGQVGSSHFIAAEFIAGQTLREKLAQGKLDLRSAFDVVRQVASALVPAHASGIVHRDIKPENVMVRPDGLVKVVDFGIAKLTETQLVTADIQAPTTMARTDTDPGTVVGTAQYMSPEQARGQPVDARTDIFSLGVLLYEMVTGKRPFEGATPTDVIVSILTEDPIAASVYTPELPPELDRIISKALEKDREERYQLVKEFLLDVKRAERRLQFEAELARSSGSTAQIAATGPTATATLTPPPAQTIDTARARPTASMAYLVGETKRHKLGAVLIAASLVAGAGLMMWRPPFSEHRVPSLTAIIIPFTTFSGAVDQPAFSPDGNQIAFTWDGGDGENLDIYVKLIGAGTPLRLTTDPAEDISPVWSPDGRYLAFLRRSATENSIFIVPALGGTERKLGKTEPSRQGWSQTRLSWAPDGKSLAVADQASPEDRFSIFLLSVEDGGKQRLTSSPPTSADHSPAFSPDGKSVAFIRSSALTSEDIYLISTHGEKLQRVTVDERQILSLAWTADGREIIFSSNRGGGYSLWRVAVPGGTPERVAATGQNAYSPAISRQGNRLVYNVSFLDSNIWRLDNSNADRQKSATRLISSTLQDHSPQISPDGKRIVFVSDRSGNAEIWICESDGSHPVQLTFFDGTVAGTPRWSPDGQQIVFDSRPAGNADIYVVSAEGGKPRPVTREPSHEVMASWSRDGRSLYFCSNRSGDYQIWKVPVAGGQPIQVTKHGGFESFESPDGELLYYTKGRGPDGIWQIPVAGGEERQVPELIDAAHWRYWAMQDKGIYFVAPVASARPAIKFFSFATHRVTQLGVLERDPLQGPPGLTISPDGQWLLYAQIDQSVSNLMLVENFR